MKTFFSEFQSKFPATYYGQYIEAIIKSISNARISSGEKIPRILLPFFSHLKINTKNIVEVGVDSEVIFSGGSQDRRADLLISFERSNGLSGVIFVEIKVDDKIIKSKKEDENDQLDDYLRALDIYESDEKYFILLTAHPVDRDLLKKMEAQAERSKHFYFGDYGRCLLASDHLSLEGMFFDYLIEKGYVMFKPNKEDKEDFLSFMVLNFLKHNSGHGRAVSDRKISNGPVVFSKLVKNWQLISYRLNASLKTKGGPAVRYLPEQIVKASVESKDSYIDYRLKMREVRESGRMWLFSEVVVDEQARLGWTVIYSISHGGESTATNKSPIRCQHIVSLRSGSKINFEVCAKEISFDDHSEMAPELIISEMLGMIKTIEQEVGVNLIEV
jgi:hypothetical protein